MCNFCKDFDFGTIKCAVDKYGSHIVMAGGAYQYPKEEQFKFCPECGRRLEPYEIDGMTNEEAERILISHLFYCGGLMPIKWVEENGAGSPFDKAYQMALDALRTRKVGDLKSGDQQK